MSALAVDRAAVQYVAPYRNKAHRSVFADGWMAAKNGEPRSAPYGADCRSSAYFRKAWWAGYDSAGTTQTGSAA